MMQAWHADPAAVRDAEAALSAALASQSASRDADSLARVLSAVGQLVVLDATESLARRLAGLQAAGRETIAGVLDRDAMSEALEDTAFRLRRLLAADDDADDDATPSRAHDCAALLEARHRAEHELLGAAFVLGCSAETLESSSPGRWVFDDVVRPESWRLVEVNDLRQAALAKITPRLRARFWWWHDGAGLGADAVGALSAAAQLVARFPNARLRFESLVRAQAIWGAPARAGAQERPVRTLRTWLARRSRSSTLDVAMTLPLAAAADNEHTVLERRELQISFAAPARLIVDLLADRRPEALPSLRTSAGLVLTATSVAHTTERFAFELSDAILDDARVSLSIPLGEGDLEIVLPEPDTA